MHPRSILIEHKHAQHYKGTTALYWARYPVDDSIALILIADNGSKEGVATVCMHGHHVDQPKDGYVWIKTWSENEGLLEDLEMANVITGDDRFEYPVNQWGSKAVLCKMTDEVFRQIYDREPPKENT